MSHNKIRNTNGSEEVPPPVKPAMLPRLSQLAPVQQAPTRETATRRMPTRRTPTQRSPTCTDALLPMKRSYAGDWNSQTENAPYMASSFSCTPPPLPPSSPFGAPSLPLSASFAATPPPLPPSSTFGATLLPPPSCYGVTVPPAPLLPPPSSSFPATLPLQASPPWTTAPAGTVASTGSSMKITPAAARFSSSVATPSQPKHSPALAGQLRSYAEAGSAYAGTGGRSGVGTSPSSARPSSGELLCVGTLTETIDNGRTVNGTTVSAEAQVLTKETGSYERSFGNNTRRRPVNSDGFVRAAEAGARTQMEMGARRGKMSDTYHLGRMIVSGSRLYANQRRSNRLLPGGSDSTTAACFMIGGTGDQMLEALLERISPCDPREERCKAVERMLKDKTRKAICMLNGGHPREARADNLAAVRICEAMADILVAHRCRKLLESRNELADRAARLEESLRAAREEAMQERRRREMVERECWCKGSAEKQVPSATLAPSPHTLTERAALGVNGAEALNGAMTTAPDAGAVTHLMDMHSFERNKLLVGAGNLSSSGFPSNASAVGNSLADAFDQETEDGNKFSCP